MLKKNVLTMQSDGNDGHRFLIAASAMFRRNPVLFAGLLTAPIVAAATSVKAGAALSLIVLIMVVPSVAISALLKYRLPDWITAAVSILLTCLLSFPAEKLASAVSPLIFDAIGIYFPLLLVSPVSLVGPGCNHLASRKPLWIVVESLFTGLGFSMVAVGMGSVRELLSAGSLWGIPLGTQLRTQAAVPVFAGFILLGFLAAFVKGCDLLVQRISRHLERVKRKKATRKQTTPEDSAETNGGIAND